MPCEPARAEPRIGDDAAWPVEVLLPDPLPVRLAVERFFADIVDEVLSPEKRPDPRAGNAGGQRAGSPGPGRSRPHARRRGR